jgi:hypothetical protein
MNNTNKQLKIAKLNLGNIRSVLVKANSEQEKKYKDKSAIEKKKKSKEKLKGKEKKLKSPLNGSLGKIQRSVESGSGGNMFDKLFEFLGILILGIIVNGIRPILATAKDMFDNIVSVFIPLQSTLKLTWAFITGEDMNDPKFDVDKKRVQDGMEEISEIKDKILDKLGPLKGPAEQLGSIVAGKLGLIQNASKNLVFARRGSEEGFYDKKRKRFTPASWTKREKSRVGEETERIQGRVMRKGERGPDIILYGGETSPEVSYPESSGTEPINKDDPTAMRDDHHPSSVRASPGGTGVPFEAGTRYKNGKIFLHWTAGEYMSTYGTYHTIFTGDGKTHRKASYNTFRDGHTWGRNNEGVALSIAALGGKTSRGLNPSEHDHGPFPIKDIQLDAMAEEIARLALAWDWKKSDIKLGRVYTHAEIAREERPPYGPRSGDPQTKWDLWNLKSGGPLWSGGNIIRNMAKAHYDRLKGGQGGSDNHNNFRSDFKNKNEKRMSAINQPMFEDLDDEEEVVDIAVQPVNTVMTRYSYVPFPQKTQNINSSTSSRHSQIWST